jgi:Beta-propeller repeat
LTISKKMNKNIYLVKMDSLGNAKWLRQASGGNSLITYVYVYDVECDHNDNVIISGEMMGPVRFGKFSYKTRSEWHREGALPKREVFLAKYDHAGNLKWLKNTGVETNFSDMAIDIDNNILLTGYFTGALLGNLKGKAQFGKKVIQTTNDLFNDVTEDIYVAKLDENGVFLWVRYFGGIAQDRGQAVTSDNEGNIYITGFFMNKFTFQGIEMESKKYRVDAKDIFVAKFDKTGQVKWMQRAGSSKSDEGTAIVADNKGNFYVSGNFEGNAAFGKNWVTSRRYSNFFLAKYNSIIQ